MQSGPSNSGETPGADASSETSNEAAPQETTATEANEAQPTPDPAQDSQASISPGGQNKPSFKLPKPTPQPKPGKKLDALLEFLKKLIKKLKKQNGDEAGAGMSISFDPKELEKFMKMAAPFLDKLKESFDKENRFADDKMADSSKAFNTLVDKLSGKDVKPEVENAAVETLLDDKGALKDTLKNVFDSPDFKDALKQTALTPIPDLGTIEASDQNEEKEEPEEELVEEEEEEEEKQEEEMEEEQPLDDQIDEMSDSLDKEASGIDAGPSSAMTEIPTLTMGGGGAGGG